MRIPFPLLPFIVLHDVPSQGYARRLPILTSPHAARQNPFSVQAPRTDERPVIYRGMLSLI
eukprot:147702-Prorocentrum_minimum.AAC.1